MLAIASAIFWALAALHIALQLEKGLAWKDLELVLPICLGGVGLGLVLGPFFGWFHDENTNTHGDGASEENDNEEHDSEPGPGTGDTPDVE